MGRRRNQRCRCRSVAPRTATPYGAAGRAIPSAHPARHRRADTPMKIAHYMPGMSLPGGIASYIERIAQAQRRAGHEVMLFDEAGGGHGLSRGGLIAVEVLHLPTGVCPRTAR